MIDCIGLTTGYSGGVVSEEITLSVKPGEIFTFIGPNGCGKTTLLKTAAGLLEPLQGEVRLNGRVPGELSPRELAQSRAYLPQLRETPDLTVGALVSHGRFPYLGFSRKLSPRDRERVDYALEISGTADWRHKRLKELSGGQRQRVYLAMTVAQDTPLLLWDEPTTYLDIHSRLAILDLARELNRAGKTVVMTLHDLPDALSVSRRVCLMDGDGRVAITAPPEEVFRSGAMDRVFSVRSEQVELASGERTWVFTRGEGERG